MKVNKQQTYFYIIAKKKKKFVPFLGRKFLKLPYGLITIIYLIGTRALQKENNFFIVLI